MSTPARIAVYLLSIVAATAYVTNALGPDDPFARLGPVAGVLGLTLALTLISYAAVEALGEVADLVVRPWVAPDPSRV